MQPKIMQTAKFRKYDEVDCEFLKRIYHHGFCTNPGDLPEIVHNVQSCCEEQVKIEFIGDVYIVTGITKTIHDTKKGVKTK